MGLPMFWTSVPYFFNLPYFLNPQNLFFNPGKTYLFNPREYYFFNPRNLFFLTPGHIVLTSQPFFFTSRPIFLTPNPFLLTLGGLSVAPTVLPALYSSLLYSTQPLIYSTLFYPTRVISLRLMWPAFRGVEMSASTATSTTSVPTPAGRYAPTTIL